MPQIAQTVLMVEPVAFSFNEQTAVNNFFQRPALDDDLQRIQTAARSEFSNMVDILRAKSIRVITVKDTEDPHTPDSIFPNNWISFHSDGRIVLYPMYAPNRRNERRMEIIETIKEAGFSVKEIIDYSALEMEDKFLEGTGSLVLDRSNRIAYASLSERTDIDLIFRFCRDFFYMPMIFNSYQSIGYRRLPIYHTNVMMSITETYAIVCLDAIDQEDERNRLARLLSKHKKAVIPISETQMKKFAGNVLQIKNINEELFLAISQSAFDSLTSRQRDILAEYNELLVIPIPTIEKYGGGSVRCMLAEVFLPAN